MHPDLTGALVRINNICIENYKNVHQGRLDFILQPGSKEEYAADVLALYGPNGSGKTALIDSIAIFKCLLSGKTLPDLYAKYISLAKEQAELQCDFLITCNGLSGHAVYTITLSAHASNADALFPDKLQIIAETLSFAWDKLVPTKTKKTANTLDKMRKEMLQPIISTKNNVLSPLRKLKELFGDSTALAQLDVIKTQAYQEGRSFIFNEKTLELLALAKSKAPMAEIITTLQEYACNRLVVIDSRANAFTHTGLALPIYTPQVSIPFYLNKPFPLTQANYELLTKEIQKINQVLPSLIPQLKLGLTKTAADLYMLSAQRNTQTSPLALESQGTLRLIFLLNQLINAYCQEGFTAAIDELDEGIFEYILGELLKSFQRYGKGQLIFTAHNLAPLTILDKKDSPLQQAKSISIAFTTTNPENRYIRIKNLSHSSNLREVYLKLISKQNIKNPEKLTQNEVLYEGDFLVKHLFQDLKL